MTRTARLWLALWSITIATCSTAQQFQPPAYYHTGAGSLPWQVITADFNNDGNLDLAVALNSEGKVAVFLGRGDGTFLAPRKFHAEGAIGLAVGDLNGDGKPDLVVTEGGRLSAYLGNGDGTFTYKPSHYGAGTLPIGVVLADFNGDGKLDVAVANHGSQGQKGHVLIRFGLGDGTFGPVVRYNVGGEPWGIAAGDLNGDGHLDLVVSKDNYGDSGNKYTLAVLLNNGDGTFRVKAEYLLGVEVTDTAIADLNHDGKPDLVVASDEEVSVLLGNGDGTFGNPTFYSMRALGQAPTGVVVADFNLDGIPDIAVSMFDGEPLASSGLLYGNGDGTFHAPIPILKGEPGGWSLIAGDFNHDGAPDLAIPIMDGKIAVLLNSH
jgi:hypothetical protein